MGIWVALVLSGLVAQGASAPAEGGQEARPTLPGEKGHILKMTREMLDLVKTHDSERRMDLFLRQAQERLKEREALEKAAAGPEKDRVGRGLGESYTKLVGTGAAGAIECGVAEGRDMKVASSRYIEAAERNREAWVKIAGLLSPEERPHYEAALAVSGHAARRVEEAQEAGRTFLALERAKAEARAREKSPDDPKAPSPAEKPKTPDSKEKGESPSPSTEPGRRDPEVDRKDRDRKDPPAGDPPLRGDQKDKDQPRNDNREEPKPDRHMNHPHRPHH